MKREFEMMNNRRCNESSDALLGEMIKEESHIDAKTPQIKNLLENRNENASKRLFDLLRLLKSMDLPATNAASLITCMKRSNAKEIRNLAEFLSKSLKVLSNEWMNGTEDLTGKKPLESLLFNVPQKRKTFLFYVGFLFLHQRLYKLSQWITRKIEENIVEKKDVSEMRREENITEEKDDTDMKQKTKTWCLKV
ncbi:uncharacterized protein A4U43_C02F17430 [Asparagus officinalis]|uniref:TFIIS N-terminal domain-containing protein n=1 Tax=Asparagus officinalis TaxID=4686 RepID=A0A5P1FNS6_ASPOF|nr:uncharacterized protein A4U43_C02F17430 [Asparagus officinalis]